MEITIKRKQIMVGGAILLLLLTATTLVLKIYYTPVEQSGTGPLAEKGMAISKNVATALEKYKNENGDYPQNLDTLVPAYLERNPQRENHGGVKFTYFPKTDKSSYEMRFIYEAPQGTVECNQSVEDPNWRCGSKY